VSATHTLTRRLGVMLTLVAATIGLLASPVHAAIDADFNRDGVPDAVVLPRPPETNIVVRISGATPQVLHFPGGLVSIAAVDLDHDGNLDLTAVSAHRGVFIWLNNGGHGRLKALKRHSRHHRVSLADARPFLAPPRSLQERSAPQGLQDDRDRQLSDGSSASVLVPNASSRTLPQARFAMPTAPGGASSSRAPPSRIPA
jgi:VCBS repeat protein